MINKAQATLEFTVVFVIMIFLLMGMLRLWKWSSDRLVQRQQIYESQRLEKGTRNSTWPEVAPEIKRFPVESGDTSW
jgi:hypothetical protein